jgi:ABC-type oligopeptide transport system ATPase subunit
MILALSGKSGSGKDIVGKIIQYLIDKNKGGYLYPNSKDNFESYCKNFKQKYCDWEIKKYAGKVKEIASLLTGIPIEKFEDQEFKKTTLSEEWDFADNDAPDNIMTIRMFLQKLGTEAMRNGLHTNVWVNALMSEYVCVHCGLNPCSISHKNLLGMQPKYPNWIITDMRFSNEMEAVVKRKGITIRINRPEINLLDHPSETSLDTAEFNYTIDNSSTIEELIKKVKDILVKEKII